MARFSDIENDVELDKAVVFALIAAHGDGLNAKSPDYLMEKWRWLQGCQNRMEAISILDMPGQRIFYQWRERWFKKPDAPFASSISDPTNEDEKQKVLRYIECDQHPPRIYCYVQDDGTHLQRDSCICGFSENPDCPIDLHRYYAGKGSTGESRLAI